MVIVRLPNRRWLQALSLTSLVLSQAVAIWASPWAYIRWEVYLACVSIDVVLLGAFLYAEFAKRRAEAQRRQLLAAEFQRLLELTSALERRRKGLIEAIEGVAKGDPTWDAEVQDLLKVLSTPDVRDRFTVNSTGQPTAETLVESIDHLGGWSQALMKDLDTLFTFYHRTHLRLTGIQSEYRLNHYRLGQTVDFLKGMGARTSAYSEKLFLEILEAFRQITQFSQDIGTDVMGRIRGLHDPASPESLEAIRQGSASIRATIEGLFGELGKADSASKKAVADNLIQMDRVQEISSAIAEFSESIRMISLNLNIEASRITRQGAGEAGRGFKVLATKLSEFATRAGDLAGQQHLIIESASSVLQKSGVAQRGHFAALLGEVPKVKQQLIPFETIVRRADLEFEAVDVAMERLAGSITESIKLVVGKFQFQDLVRQEQEHILLLFTHVRDVANATDDRGAPLDGAAKLQALKALLGTFEGMVTTANEHAVLRDFRKAAGLEVVEDPEALIAGTVRLF